MIDGFGNVKPRSKTGAVAAKNLLSKCVEMFESIECESFSEAVVTCDFSDLGVVFELELIFADCKDDVLWPHELES